MAIDLESRVVHTLPVSDAGCGDIQIQSDGCRLWVDYEFSSPGDGQKIVGTLYFSEVIAFRFRDEMHSRGFAQESYDSVVELLDSDWLRELSNIEPEGISGGIEGKKHFLVMLSSNGYLEAIAKRFEELPHRQGHLKKG